ncbi:hypothetical protein ACFL96_14025 [Thermoproteota archaeon]
MITDDAWDAWQEQGTFNHEVIQRWMSAWNMKIKHQRHYALLMLMRGVSCLLMKNRRFILTNTTKLDPRIGMIYFSDSGSGKGMGVAQYVGVFREVGLNIESLKKPTPEKLIGSIDSTADTRNRQKGYSPTDEKYLNPIIPGYFEICDDIIFDEAENSFNGQQYGDELLRNVRCALDNYGSPNNMMKSETLKNMVGHTYPCACNVAFLSYHLDNVSKSILKNGIFQRPVSFFYHIGKPEMVDILTSPKQSIIKDIEKARLKTVADLKKVAHFIETMDSDIYISDEAVKLAEKSSLYELGEISKDEDIRSRMQSFLPRVKDNLFRCAAVLAVIKGRKIVNEADVEEAQLIVLTLGYQSMKRELVVYGALAKEQQQWYMDLKKNLHKNRYTKEIVNSIMGKVWGVSRMTAIARLKKMADVFEVVKGKGNTKLVKLI